MGTSVAMGFNNSILARFFSLFIREKAVKQDIKKEVGAAETADVEIEKIWSVIRKKRDEGLDISESECARMITDSFAKLRTQFSDDQLDETYTWPRYVKAAAHCCSEPIRDLVEYVTESNYIFLTKRLSDLVKSVQNSDHADAADNADHFANAVYMHILQTINPLDIPSLLSLGREAQKKKNYSDAREWYSKIVETDEPFNGITALLACCEEEIKTILSNSGSDYSRNPKIKEKVRELNSYQASVYEEWSRILKDRISRDEDVPEQAKKEYVTLITGYARLERNRGNYERAFRLLESASRTYPESYRIYTEEAMLYQFRSYKNRYYSLDKAVDTFKKAYTVISEGSSNASGNRKRRKSILMPLANTYFQMGRYEDASDVCDIVLLIDAKERRAIELKDRILCLKHIR